MVHNESVCPLKNSKYCSNCAKYGHRLNECPAKPSLMYTEPIYKEQLMPPSELKENNITTKTPFQRFSIGTKDLLEIKDKDPIITAYLVSNNIKIPKGFTKKEVLEEYAKNNNKRLVYIV
jgi:hypothetical protein